MNLEYTIKGYYILIKIKSEEKVKNMENFEIIDRYGTKVYGNKWLVIVVFRGFFCMGRK